MNVVTDETPAKPARCTRCARPLRQAHRFCPECGLPVGGGVLSNQIRRASAQTRGQGRQRRRRRWLPAIVLAGMVGFVVVLGLVLFNRPLVENVFPDGHATAQRTVHTAHQWEPPWTFLPKGTVFVGEPLPPVDDDLDASLLLYRGEDEEEVSARLVDRYRITNRDWRRFLIAEEESLRRDGLWHGGAYPRAASGWHLDADGLPEPPRHPVHGPEWEGPVAYVSHEAVARCVAFLWRDRPERVLRHWGGVSNREWKAFLDSARDDLNAEGQRDLFTPPDWSLDGDTGDPVPPEDSGEGLVHGVPYEALQRFHRWRHEVRIPHDFWVSTYEITNELWRDFIEHEEQALREAGLWAEAVPGSKGQWSRDTSGRWTPPVGELDRPVVNVSAAAVGVFAAWLTERLGDPDVEIRMPTQAEWIYAARGDTRGVYPWGDRFLGRPTEGTGGHAKMRPGLHANHASVAQYVDDDTSPLGVVGLGTNVAEWVTRGVRGGTEIRGASMEIRGASFADDLASGLRNAKVWNARLIESSQRLNHVGVRLVKVTRSAAGSD